MSDTSLTIELKANTSAAVSEVGKLKTELRDTTTAATVAGSAQKQLGLDVGRTSAQVAEAKQALANLTAASRNVELTTAAYGKESRQAAEAVAKQAAAQREATKAAAAAAAATTRLLADTRAVAVAQDGQMSPALKRAATNAIRFGENVERITDDLHRMELAAVATARATEDKLAKATARASADLASLHGSTSKVSTGMIALGTAGGNLLASGAQRAVHGLGEAMSFTLRSAIDMESGMADVAKVVDGLKTPTGAATAEYHAMEESLFGLSQRIAIAPEGFAKLAAAAGQAGIAGSELVGFSEEAAKVAVAFDVTAEEAGSGLVKLRTGLNLSQPEVMGLAGSINVLSNSLAATAPQVLDAVQRVGSIGKATNISGQEIAALSAAMIAAGASAEQAGTGTKNFLLTLSIGSAATKHQVEAFTALGLSAERVAENVTSRDAITRAEQMRQVIERIGELGDAERVSVMSKLFGKETLGTIGPLATNLELLTESLELAADKTKALGSVQAEFESRSSTTANTLQLLKNNVSVAAITIGNALLPEISDMAKELSSWVKENRELIKSNVVGFIHGVVDAAKGLAPIVIGAGKALGVVVDMLGGVERAIGPVVAGLGALKIAATLALGPWGILAAGIIAGAVAIGQEMADAERRTMSLIQAAGRLKDIATTQYGLEKKSAQELLVMQAELDKQREDSQTISARSASGRFLSPAELKQRELERKADILAIDAQQKLVAAALSTKTKELETSISIRKETERTAEAEKLRADRMKLELDYLNSLDKLSDRQARRKRALEKVGIEDENGDGKKKKGGKAKEAVAVGSLSDRGGDVFDGTVQTEVVARAAPEAAAQGRADAEAKLFDEQMTRYDREAEALDAQGQREAERIDGLLHTVEVEDQVETRRREMQDQRLDREQEYARWQVRNARNETQREQAQTRLEAIEHKKRLVGLTRAAEEERAVLAQRRETVAAITGGVTSLAGSMIGGLEALVNGQKGALTRALADWTKDLAVRSGLKALEEFMLAAAAAASYNYPGAAAHATAGGMAVGVAVAAGGASVGLGAAASSLERGGAAGAPSAGAPAGTDPASAGSGSGSGADKLSHLDVPVSHPTSGGKMNADAGGITININVAGPVGKDQAHAIGESVRRALQKTKAQGPRT